MRFVLITACLGLLIFGAGLSLGQAREAAAVSLRGNVDINAETILLSDLLPEHVSGALRAESAEIELGRAPAPGSLRVFTEEQILEHLRSLPDLRRRLAIPPQIVIARPGWPIERESVRAAIARFLARPGMQYGELPDSTVLRIAAVASRQSGPVLEVTGAAPEQGQRAILFRLHCVDPSLCGTFLVRAEMSPPAHAARTFPASAELKPGAALAEAGKPATLILESPNLRISLPVICLSRGALNQQIRVFDARHHRVFRAEVVGSGLLHATL